MASRVRGLDALKRQLAALPKACLEETSQALQAGASKMAAAVARSAPDPKLREATGFVAGDAAAGPSGVLSAGAKSSGQSTQLGLQGLRYTVFSGSADAFWARWSEFGTAPHSLAKGADRSSGKSGKLQNTGPQHPGARAQPYFFPTIRAHRGSIKSQVVSAQRRAVKRAIGGYQSTGAYDTRGSKG